MKVTFPCVQVFLISIFVLDSQKTFAQSTSQKKDDIVLAGYRSTIDSLDNSIIQLIGEREKVVREVGIYKAKNKIPPLQTNRFKQVLEKSIATGKEQGLSSEFITRLMNLIHDESLKLENEIKNK